MEMMRARRACCLPTGFCFLLRLIYSVLHRHMKLARYASQLEAEKYVEQYLCLHLDINRVLSFINGQIKFIDNFVCSIGNMFVKFHQEILSIIQNIEVQ